MMPKTPRPTILVIDDEPDLLKMLKRRLEHWGYRALTAASGEEGLGLVERERPDLILLDIMMPKMKGRDVCAHLKANPQTADVPVIFLSALELPDHIKAGLDIGGEDYLVKPFEPEDLKDRIKVCLMRHQSKAT